MKEYKFFKIRWLALFCCVGFLFFSQSVFAANHPYDRWSERGRIISWKHLKCLSKNKIYHSIMEMPWKDTYPNMDLSDLWDFFTSHELRRAIHYRIDVYQLVYETIDAHGNPTAASGAVLVPRNLHKRGSLLSLQRGTIFLDNDAPSSGGLENWGIWRGLLPASSGFFTIMPDFLGYGASKHMVHPYAMAKPTATAAIDMIVAARKFSEIIHWNLDDKLFLAGLSEGGYSTMAIQKEIEANYSSSMQVTASAPAGGPYTPSIILGSVFASEYAFAPNIVSHILMSYNDTYRFDRPLSDFFNPPYDEDLWTLQDKAHSEDYIESQLPLYSSELYTATFLSDYNGSGETDLKQAVAENDIHVGWTPIAPVRIYSGTEETVVPYPISELLYYYLNQPGTDVALIPVQDADHLQSIVPITLLTIDWFKTF